MKSTIFLACAMMLAALDACTPPTQYADAKPGQTPLPPVQRERLAYLKQTGSIPITCAAGGDCTEKWARALEWVNRNSVYSIKTSTDSGIVTNGPIEPTTDSAFTVTKSPQGTNGFIIHFISTCGEQAQQTTAGHCIPTSLELESSFNNYVMYGN